MASVPGIKEEAGSESLAPAIGLGRAKEWL